MAGLLTGVFSSAVAKADEAFFQNEVWAKVGELSCLKCHNSTGVAEDSFFVLQDSLLLEGAEKAAADQANFKAFSKMARKQKEGASVILQKVTGGLDHEGEEVLSRNSTGYRILEQFVHDSAGELKSLDESTGFFDDVEMLDDRRLLRRVTLSLAGRLPTASELDRVAEQGLESFEQILDDLMKEDAFYARLSEGFNDILLTMGHEDVAARILGYRNFGNTRLWYQKVDFSDIKEERERNEAKWSLARQTGANLLREPFELIEYIVRNERPITDLVTADYLMVSPWTAKAYGIYDAVKDRFSQPEDPKEFIPAKLPSLTRNDGRPDQESPTGFYPHAGLLTTFHYLQRYPTTETNRNRLRVRKFYEHFLGFDLMTIALREGDPVAISKKHQNAVMDAPSCVICHQVMDPVAGLFQDYQNPSADTGPYGPREEGWFTDVFSPGFEGRKLPDSERWRALQWLGEITAKDHRFATAMVEHVYYILTGRKVILPPKDIEDPMFLSRRRAHIEQRRWIESVAKDLEQSDFNLKVVFKKLIVSPFYRADGLATIAVNPERLAELDDLGLMHLLTPEQIDRKVGAVFGRPWKNFSDQLKMLYGGIDSWEVTERLQDPSGAMGAIQRILANDVACRNVADDFSKPAGERTLFPGIELEIVPGFSEENDQLIRRAIVHLHDRLLGHRDAGNSPEVDSTFQLFAEVIQDAHERGGFEETEAYACRSGDGEGGRDPDPHYTLRSWRAVVTYLLRHPDFLYE